jgi:hypothetical protein
MEKHSRVVHEDAEPKPTMALLPQHFFASHPKLLRICAGARVLICDHAIIPADVGVELWQRRRMDGG